MNRSAFFALIWLGFIGYATVVAPPSEPDTFALIQDLSTGQWNGINPLIVSLFNLMGIWPLIYGSLMITDGCGQRIVAWPFAIASFGLGAFAVLPYLALRAPNPGAIDHPTRLLHVANSRWFGVAIALGAVGFLAYGVLKGDWSSFIEQWQHSKFIHVMSLDFCMLCVLVGTMLGDDMVRRGLSDRRLFWAIALTPLLGIIAYLCLRPPLTTHPETVQNPA
ncbi:MAG: DUF2834 domain-containing protein [Cyanobacteria bacterium J06627_8]